MCSILRFDMGALSKGSEGTVEMFPGRRMLYFGALCLVVLILLHMSFIYIPAYTFHFERYTAAEIWAGHYDPHPAGSIYLAAIPTVVAGVCVGLPVWLVLLIGLIGKWTSLSWRDRILLPLVLVAALVTVRAPSAPVDAFVIWLLD